jgi:hypothetical protein
MLPRPSRLAGKRDFYVYVQEAVRELMREWAERKARPDAP